MARSPGLALYLVSRSLAGGSRPRSTPAAASSFAARPEGTLAWFQVCDGSRAEAVVEVANRLVRGRRRCSALVTSTGPQLTLVSPPLFAAAAPDDAPRDLKAFLDHWRPDIAVLAGEVDHPNTILELSERSVPVHLVDARVPAGAARRLRWAPRAAASLFERVRRIVTPTEADAEVFRRLRAPADRIEARGALEEGTAPKPCNESDRSALAALLAARPVWLATGVGETEADAVIEAHTKASRVAHRLLLILVPESAEDGPAIQARLEDAGWVTGLRSRGDEPDPNVQIFVADTPEEMGLWYRLAPITFLGRSLTPDAPGQNPCEPAALGSAILVGPYTGDYRTTVARFLQAGAARTVGSADALGDAVMALLAPDRAADLARRAWEVTSAGAEVTDRVLEVLHEALDERGVP